MKELNDQRACPHRWVRVAPTEDENWTELQGYLLGPPDTPYEGAVCNVLVKVSRDYPFKAPTLSFNARIYHPCVNRNGGYVMVLLTATGREEFTRMARMWATRYADDENDMRDTVRGQPASPPHTL